MDEIEVREIGFADPRVQALVTEALTELGGRYGGSGDDTPVTLTDFDPPVGAFFAAVDGDALVGCGGWRRHGTDAELKRMFTTPAARGRGVARRLLATIEESARAAGMKRVILETGDKQPEAIGLYESAGYVRIPDFGYYKGAPGVLSFALDL
ncbi:GNAT family N-acetyltransferase [Actinoplanes sp. NBRC 103695]|uniref:GNAT family N-acetyltransferase n=1 Tax=Actinoplanes sp. NBRC 103695 TaxID=3032202 RepID=UPI0024A08241|nr:GNAT family N-acetyltransferase [Actinoplanes sp. NBRC 103695]GLY94581.1 N-acetyltransferase [Actinoplanes sp. NBRC 103695]